MANDRHGAAAGSVPEAEALASALAQELEALCARLRRAASSRTARKAAPPSRFVESRRTATAPRRRTPTPSPESPATSGLAALRASGRRTARLVRGSVVHPGAPGQTPHCWIEVDDEVHDPSLGDGRRVWPRDLYYLVFRPVPREAA